MKVNDADGNPVEIAAVVVWQVADTSRAVFAVDDYIDFVRVQSESASGTWQGRIRTTTPPVMARRFGGSTDEVAGELADELAQRVAGAGVQIVEVRVSHLAYASEIAQAMLRRQQANAVVAARSSDRFTAPRTRARGRGTLRTSRPPAPQPRGVRGSASRRTG